MLTRSAPSPRGIFARRSRQFQHTTPRATPWRSQESGELAHLAAWLREEMERTGGRLRDAGRLLELGCGSGDLLAELRDLAGVCELWGCDDSASEIEQAEEHHSPPARFFVHSATPHLPFEDRSFGAVLAFGLLIRRTALSDGWLLEMRRILRPAGRLVLGILEQQSDLPQTSRSQVQYHDRSQLLCRLAVWFRVLSVTGEGDGVATVLVLERL